MQNSKVFSINALVPLVGKRDLDGRDIALSWTKAHEAWVATNHTVGFLVKYELENSPQEILTALRKIAEQERDRAANALKIIEAVVAQISPDLPN